MTLDRYYKELSRIADRFIHHEEARQDYLAALNRKLDGMLAGR